MERDSNLSGGRKFELRDIEPVAPWFGFPRSNATAASPNRAPEDRVPVTVQTVPEGRWTADHVERLLNTAPTEERDTSGLVPVVSITNDDDGNIVVTSLRTDAPRFQERLDFRTPPPWNEGAGVALGASRAMEKAHSLGLRHGALQPRDVIVAGSELAVAGIGLSLGGIPEGDLPMAPEVARSGVPTVPGDVYSLGLLLRAGTAGDPNTPEEISQLITDATAEDSSDRIPSALAFSERLDQAGGQVMRTFTPMGFADSPLVAAPSEAVVAPPTKVVAPVAGTPAVASSPSSTRKVLPWIVGLGLAGVVGFGLWAAATGGGGSSTTTTLAPTSVTTTATTVPTTTEAPTTATSDPTVITQPTTATTATTVESTTTPPPPPAVDPTPIEDAGLELLHGLNEPAVDTYLNGELLVGGFEPGEIAGPLALDAGDYDVQLFVATDDPAQAASDRSDNPIIDQTVRLSGSPETVVVSSNGADGAALSVFSDDLSPVGAGQGRISLRNPTDATILVSIEPDSQGGQAIESQAISPGAVLSRELPAGDYRLFISEENGDSLLSTVVSNTEGDVTAGTFLADGSPRMIFQRVGGLGTPPVGIPTGSSGLLPGSGDPVQGLLIAAAGSFGLFALIGRERFRRSEAY